MDKVTHDKDGKTPGLVYLEKMQKEKHGYPILV